MSEEQRNIMLDLETMGVGPNAAIVAIGAVEFVLPVKESMATVGRIGEITREFYRTVDLQSSVDAGGVIDPSTVMWWLEQSDEARAELTREAGRENIAGALQLFREWLGGRDCLIWGNGASFDNVILGSAYTKLSGIDFVPWKFRNNRCYRTVKALNKHIPADEVGGVAHNAVDDAKYQALHLIKIYNSK